MFRKPVDEIYFFDFSNVFDTYSDFGRKCFWLLAKKSSRKVVKLLLFAFREYTWMKTNFFLKKSFWFDFRTSSEAVSDYQQIFYREVVKTVLYVFRKQIEESVFSQIFWFFCIFGIQAKLFLTFGTFYSQIWQNCFLRVQTNSLMENNSSLKTSSIFWTLVDALFWLMTILSLHIFQKCFLRLQGNTLIKKLFWKTLPHFFRTVSNSFPDFWQKL